MIRVTFDPTSGCTVIVAWDDDKPIASYDAVTGEAAMKPAIRETPLALRCGQAVAHFYSIHHELIEKAVLRKNAEWIYKGIME